MFLIDGSSFCYRAFYAVRNLNTSKGQPTNAVFGVVTMLKKLMEEENPVFMAVAFDMAKPTFRHVRYAGYKEHRKPMPEELVSQLPFIRRVFDAYRIPVFEKEGYEADDILGTIARQASRHGFDVYLVTSDKDSFQLLGSNVKVYKPTREGYEIVDEQALRKKWGVRPDQVVEVMALMGDDTDAIPGVPGIGEKTAVELIQKFGSVDNLMKNVAQVPGQARRQALCEHLDQLKMSHELALLDTAVPIELNLNSLRVREPNQQALYELFQELEFKKLLKEMAPPKRACAAIEIRTVAQAGELSGLLEKMRRSGRSAVVPVRGGSDGVGPRFQGIAVSFEAGSAWIIPGREVPDSLRELLADPRFLKVCPLMKEFILVLLEQCLEFSGTGWWDPCLASYLLDPARPSHGVAALAEEFLQAPFGPADAQGTAAMEAEAALRLYPRLEKEIEAKNLALLLEEVETPLAVLLARMELRGIGVNLDELRSLSKEIDRTLEGLTQQIHHLAGEETLNINSPKQLSQVLFEKLKLPVIKKTKTGASTDEEVLKRLSSVHDLPAKILEYRELAKLRSTYVEALPKLVDPASGRIHTSFNQMVTATGRLSSSQPNLQNIPIRTELGRRIRRAFVPTQSAGLFLAADYSQIELRIMAHLSQDERLLEAFRNGEDIHRVTAAEIFHVPPADVTADQRSAAKTINFGIMYGMTPFGLSKELGIDPTEAGEFIERYFSQYPKVRVYLQRCLEESRRNGYCVTLFNRRRYIPELQAKDPVVRQFAERTAINAPIQGSAADLIKIAMIDLDRAMRAKGLRSSMVLQVHDELIFDIDGRELEPMKRLVKEIMEAPVLQGKPLKLSVPVEVRLKVGSNWLEASVS